MKDSDILQTPVAEVHLEDGILYTRLTNPSITLDDAKEHIRLSKERYGHLMPLPTIVDTTLSRNVSKEARDYFASADVSALTSCSAILLQSAFSRIAGNLFLQFNKPKYPTKLFTDKAKAIAWIREMTTPKR